jgi:hypothetical protein
VRIFDIVLEIHAMSVRRFDMPHITVRDGIPGAGCAFP